MGNFTLKGETQPLEIRLKISQSMKGKQNSLGSKHSEEWKKNMSIAMKGRPYQGGMLGKKHSDETKRKIGLGNKGKKLSQEDAHRCRTQTIGLVPWNKGLKGFQLGENHPRWIKDRTKLSVNEKKHLDTQYKYWMLSVKKRDGWRCKIANDNCSGRLEAHHILGWRSHPELRYKINNGITLCHFHHPLKRDDEKKLSPYFQKLVNEMQ